jgi:hypothetical protein
MITKPCHVSFIECLCDTYRCASFQYDAKEINYLKVTKESNLVRVIINVI